MIVNNNDIYQKLSNDNIKLKQKKKTFEYIKDFGYYRLIICYGNYLKQLLNKKINTKEIISLFNFDNELSNWIIYYLLKFEQKFNSVAIDEIFKFNNLNDDYVLKITNNPAYTVLRNKGYADFIDNIYENAKACNLIDAKLKASSLENIPLKILSLSWSFHTLISFVNLQDEKVIRNITKRFGINDNFHNEFISICHSIRKFRNNLSHNGLCICSSLSYYSREFNQVLNNISNQKYNENSQIDINKLIKILEYLLKAKNMKKELKKIIKQNKLGGVLSHKIEQILNV